MCSVSVVCQTLFWELEIEQEENRPSQNGALAEGRNPQTDSYNWLRHVQGRLLGEHMGAPPNSEVRDGFPEEE